MPKNENKNENTILENKKIWIEIDNLKTTLDSLSFKIGEINVENEQKMDQKISQISAEIVTNREKTASVRQIANEEFAKIKEKFDQLQSRITNLEPGMEIIFIFLA